MSILKRSAVWAVIGIAILASAFVAVWVVLSFFPKPAQPSVPIGAVIPWIPPSPVASIGEAKKLLPKEFAICEQYAMDDPDTAFNEKEIPDLRDTFLMGTEPLKVAKFGGNNEQSWEHGHDVDCRLRNKQVEGGQCAIVQGDDGVRGWTGGVAEPVKKFDNRPKYIGVLYIIRVR